MQTKPKIGQHVFYYEYPFRIRELIVTKHDPQYPNYVYCRTNESYSEDPSEEQTFDCAWKVVLFPTYREAADASIQHHEFQIKEIKSDRRYNA